MGASVVVRLSFTAIGTPWSAECRLPAARSLSAALAAASALSRFRCRYVRFLEPAEIQKIGGDRVKQLIAVRHGIAGDDAKRIVRIIKDSKMKVQASIQGDAVRVTGTKRDDLQAVINLLKKEVTDLPLGFGNFRD